MRYGLFTVHCLLFAVKGGRWELALEALEDMRALGLRANGHHWMAAIDA